LRKSKIETYSELLNDGGSTLELLSLERKHRVIPLRKATLSALSKGWGNADLLGETHVKGREALSVRVELVVIELSELLSDRVDVSLLEIGKVVSEFRREK
jgi:hypothetical protein